MQLSKDMLTATAEVIGVVVSILGPIVGWLAKSGLNLSKAHTELDATVKAHLDDYDAFKLQHRDNPTRLTKVEDAIVGIQTAMERNDKQFSAILDKLDAIPRLNALMEAYGSMAQMVVPRAEVEARVKSVEERLQRVENDVRDGRK